MYRPSRPSSSNTPQWLTSFATTNQPWSTGPSPHHQCVAVNDGNTRRRSWTRARLTGSYRDPYSAPWSLQNLPCWQRDHYKTRSSLQSVISFSHFNEAFNYGAKTTGFHPHQDLELPKWDKLFGPLTLPTSLITLLGHPFNRWNPTSKELSSTGRTISVLASTTRPLTTRFLILQSSAQWTNIRTRWFPFWSPIWWRNLENPIHGPLGKAVNFLQATFWPKKETVWKQPPYHLFRGFTFQAHAEYSGTDDFPTHPGGVSTAFRHGRCIPPSFHLRPGSWTRRFWTLQSRPCWFLHQHRPNEVHRSLAFAFGLSSSTYGCQRQQSVSCLPRTKQQSRRLHQGTNISSFKCHRENPHQGRPGTTDHCVKHADLQTGTTVHSPTAG